MLPSPGRGLTVGTPGTPAVEFYLKGVRTSGVLIKRAGKRLRVQHDSGNSWVDLADLIETDGGASSSGTPHPSPLLVSPAPPINARPRLDDGDDNRVRGKAFGETPTPATPPPVFLTPSERNERMRTPMVKTAAMAFGASAQKPGAPPPLAPADAPPTHPKLLLSCAIDTWIDFVEWHAVWLGMLDAAKQHAGTKSLMLLSLRAAEQAARPSEPKEIAARRARRAGLRCVRVLLARGFRGFVQHLARHLELARSVRRAARYHARYQMRATLQMLLANREVVHTLSDSSFRYVIGLRFSLRTWHAAWFAWRANLGRRDIMRRRAIKRMARGSLQHDLADLGAAFSFRAIPPLPPMGSPRPNGQEEQEPLPRRVMIPRDEWSAEVLRLINKWTAGANRDWVASAMLAEQHTGRRAHSAFLLALGLHAPQARQYIRLWLRRVSWQKDARVKGQILVHAQTLSRTFRMWRRDGHWQALLLVARYVSYRHRCRAVFRRLRRDGELSNPTYAVRWKSESYGPLLWLQVARGLARFWEATADLIHRDWCQGRAYFHWQSTAALQALRALHRFTQVQLNLKIDRMLVAQTLGSFDVRLLPSHPGSPTTVQVDQGNQLHWGANRGRSEIERLRESLLGAQSPIVGATAVSAV